MNQITHKYMTDVRARVNEYNVPCELEVCARPCLRIVRDGTGIVGSLAYSLYRVRFLCDIDVDRYQ